MRIGEETAQKLSLVAGPLLLQPPNRVRLTSNAGINLMSDLYVLDDLLAHLRFLRGLTCGEDDGCDGAKGYYRCNECRSVF